MKHPELASPSAMSAGARAGELVSILGTAIVRTHISDAQKQSGVGLGFLPEQRVHTTPYQQEKV